MTALIAAFVAGFLSVLIFHQGVWAIFAAAGRTPAPAWDMKRVPPLGVPLVLSAAFWGGAWGVALALAMPALMPILGYWTTCIVVGGLATSLVAMFIVYPMKGRAFAGGWNPFVWMLALLVNAAWGFGFGLLLPLVRRVL